jgi:hypothetical protein
VPGRAFAVAARQERLTDRPSGPKVSVDVRYRGRSVSRCATAEGPGVRRPCDTFDAFDIFDINDIFGSFSRGHCGAAWRQRLQRQTRVRTPGATASRTQPSARRHRLADNVSVRSGTWPHAVLAILLPFVSVSSRQHC